MCPANPGFAYHSMYVCNNFSLGKHNCKGNCGCVAVGCTQHWRWKKGKPPPRDTGTSGCVDYQLYHFGAYQGSVPGKTKQERFFSDYHNIVKWVKPLDGTTIFCNWDSEMIADVYERVKTVYAGHTVPATKTLYLFIPDLFIILDRAQVWGKWKKECPFLPRKIDRVSGEDYVALLEHVTAKISSAIKGGRAFTLDGRPPVSVRSVDQLRLQTPLQLGKPANIGHTLGKVIDNIVREG